MPKLTIKKGRKINHYKYLCQRDKVIPIIGKITPLIKNCKYNLNLIFILLLYCFKKFLDIR